METAILTGSEGQIGQSFVSRLKELDYKVIGIDIVDQVNDGIIYHRADITKKHEIESVLKQHNENITVLINNAGTSVFSPFEERTEDQIDMVMNVNLKGNILMTQLVYNKYFKVNNNGTIINIGSIYGIVSGDMSIYNEDDRRTPEIYGATKAGLIQMTRYFAVHLADQNIRVNSISPGGIFNKNKPQNKKFVKNYSLRSPLKRMAKQEEILGAIFYLSSDSASYTSGHNLVIDGGMSCW